MSENSKEFRVVMKVVQETATQNTPPAKRARWNWKKYDDKKASRFISTKSMQYKYKFMCRSNFKKKPDGFINTYKLTNVIKVGNY